MDTRNRTRAAALMFALAAATLATDRPSAQGGRPPDIAGEWRVDNAEDPGQPPFANYLGIAFNEAGRLRADTTPESIWGTPEYQCRPHSAPHQWRGVGGARILKEQDPLTRETRVFHLQYMRSLNRPIFMDGRPHPPAYAPHSWSGFSTGEWLGHTLKVTTTHLKDGYLKRGGPQTSDMYTMTEFITRHDDILTVVHGGGRPDLSRRAVRAVGHVDVRPDGGPEHGDLHRLVVRRERRHGSPLGAALPPGPEQRDRRVHEGPALDSVRCRSAAASRRCIRSTARS